MPRSEKDHIIVCFYYFLIKNKIPTYDNIKIATISPTALGACPVLVPDVRAVRHVFAADLLARVPGRTALRHVELLGCALRKVRRTAPADFGHADVFALLTGFDRVQALFGVGRLIGADVALEAVAY